MIMMPDTNIIIVVIVVICTAIPVTVALVEYAKNRRARSGPRSVPQLRRPNVKLGKNTFMVNGRYEVKSQAFKQGGMATIWLGVERKTSRPCIIKTPRRGTNMDNVYLDKLMLEAGYLKRLNHPGIVRYMDDFFYSGEFHLVMEYLKGETLMASSPRSSPGEQKVIDWAGQLLDALAYINAVGIIHRDVNPKNIMLCDDGSVKLIDFGTAKSLYESDEDKASTDPFTQIANRGFDIPELFLGGDSDGRSDLCGLAQTCIYLLTLRQPNEICQSLFKSSWPRTYDEAEDLAVYLISKGVSRRTARCLAQAVHYYPGSRFSDARAMRAALTATGAPAPKPVVEAAGQ